jgi:hypothetical protein
MQKSKKFIETQSLCRRVHATYYYKDHGKMFSTQPCKAVFRSRTMSQEPTKKSGRCLLAIKYNTHANYYYFKIYLDLLKHQINF